MPNDKIEFTALLLVPPTKLSEIDATHEAEYSWVNDSTCRCRLLHLDEESSTYGTASWFFGEVMHGLASRWVPSPSVYLPGGHAGNHRPPDRKE
eukprot:1159555-Pelagomonas_calceolata.AAC.14